MNDLMNNLGSRLRETRESQSIKQIDVARALNLSQAAISGYEVSGRLPSIETLVDLAVYYKVSVDYLLGITAEDMLRNEANKRPLERLSRISQPDSIHPVNMEAFVRLANALLSYVAVGSPAGSAPIRTAGDVVHAAANLLDAAAEDSAADVIDAANALAAAGLSATETVREYVAGAEK